MVPICHPILLIEENADDHAAIVRALRQQGVENPIVHFADSQSALRFLGRRQAVRPTPKVPASCPGVLLLDLSHSGNRSCGLLAGLKRQPVLRDIPIIVLATASDVEDLEDCYAAGAQGHIVKPVNFDGFIQALQRLSGCWFELVRRPVMA